MRILVEYLGFAVIAGVALAFQLRAARSEAEEEIKDLEAEAGRAAPPDVIEWLRQEALRRRRWTGAAAVIGPMGGFVAAGPDDPILKTWALIAISCAVAISLATLVAVSRSRPPGQGPVRAATLGARSVADYLPRRQARANKLNLALALATLAVAVLFYSADSGPAWLVVLGGVSVPVVLGTWQVQRLAVQRPRAAGSADDLFWQEHLLVSTLPVLPRTGSLTAVITAAGVVWVTLETGESVAPVLGATTLLIALVVSIYLLLPRDGEDDEIVPALTRRSTAR